MKQTLIHLINQALQGLTLQPTHFSIEHPNLETHGDYATNAALVLFPKLKEEGNSEFSNPRELAEAIAEKLLAIYPEPKPAISVAGPGFINLTYPAGIFLKEARKAAELQDHYGTSGKNRGKRIIVEYSSPNIAKPFTIGHLRSTIIGDAIANIKEATGWEVLRDNHLGDWGTQFGKLICAIKKNWMSLEEIEQAQRPVKLLVELYVRFHQEAKDNPGLEDEARAWFKKLEDHDAEALDIWQKCIDWSWKEFSRIYDLLGVTFSPQFNQGRGLGESFFEDKMATVIDELIARNMLREGENGAQLVFFPEDKYPPLMILKKDGTSLYATRDLATDKYRRENYQPDLIINEVGAEQTLYFRQLFEVEKMLGWFTEGQRIHIGHGLYRFAEGKMSTRKGNVVWLEDVLSEAAHRALNTMAQAVRREKQDSEAENALGEIIGIGALKWNDLKGETKRDIVFDWNEILTMKGDSGPYVQYTYARCKSVLNKAGDNIDFEPNVAESDLNQEEIAILRWLARYPEAVEMASDNNTPATIANYLFELAQRFNSFYNRHSILGNDTNPVDDTAKNLRLLITKAVSVVLKNGLHLLGIKTPEKM